MNGLFLLYHAFLFEMDITDLKNGHVIPKFWVLENLFSYANFVFVVGGSKSKSKRICGSFSKDLRPRYGNA